MLCPYPIGRLLDCTYVIRFTYLLGSFMPFDRTCFLLGRAHSVFVEIFRQSLFAHATLDAHAVRTCPRKTVTGGLDSPLLFSSQVTHSLGRPAAKWRAAIRGCQSSREPRFTATA